MKNQNALKRVCLFNPQGYVEYPAPLGKTDTGGQTAYIFQLARALGKLGIKVDILTRKFESYTSTEDLWENVRIVRIPAGSNSFVEKEKLYELMPEWVENIMSYMKENKISYEIVHSHYWDGGYAAMLFSKLMNIPHVHTPHTLGKMKQIDLSAEKAPPQKLDSLYKYQVRIAMEQKIYSTSDAVVVLCKTSQIQLLQHYILDFDKIHVIYTGIETSVFNPEKNEYDKKVPSQPNTIMTASRLVPAKGIDRVIEAVNLLKDKIDFHFNIIGGSLTEVGSVEEETTEKQLVALVKKYKLEDKITFIDNLDHDSVLPAYFRNAGVFILASRYEPFGLTSMEAMACGTPTIVSSAAGSREVVIDGLNGYICDTEDRQALADLIFKILTDKTSNKKMRDNAAFTIKENYTWEKIALQFIDLYSQLLSNSKKK